MPRTTQAYRADQPIVPELAAGALIFHPRDRDLLLLHHLKESRWCFPKGHVDPGESLASAALREIEEETGLSKVKLDGEIGEVTYRFYRPATRENVHKTSVYFLGWTDERALRLESTFDRADWTGVDRALSLVPYDTDRTMLEAARRRLRDRPSA